jgi:putative heme degradation protein
MAASEIRGLIALYLNDAIDLSLFADRFEAIFADVEDSNDEVAIQLSYRVEAALTKVSDGLISAKDFMDILTECRSGFTVTKSEVISQYTPPENEVEVYSVDDQGQLVLT